MMETGHGPEALEEVRLRFAEEWEDGRGPALETYLRRYPQFAAELARLAAELFELDAAPRDAAHDPAGEEDPALARIYSLLDVPTPPP